MQPIPKIMLGGDESILLYPEQDRPDSGPLQGVTSISFLVEEQMYCYINKNNELRIHSGQATQTVSLIVLFLSGKCLKVHSVFP